MGPHSAPTPEPSNGPQDPDTLLAAINWPGPVATAAQASLCLQAISALVPAGRCSDAVGVLARLEGNGWLCLRNGWVGHAPFSEMLQKLILTTPIAGQELSNSTIAALHSQRATCLRFINVPTDLVLEEFRQAEKLFIADRNSAKAASVARQTALFLLQSFREEGGFELIFEAARSIELASEHAKEVERSIADPQTIWLLDVGIPCTTLYCRFLKTDEKEFKNEALTNEFMTAADTIVANAEMSCPNDLIRGLPLFELSQVYCQVANASNGQKTQILEKVISLSQSCEEKNRKDSRIDGWDEGITKLAMAFAYKELDRKDEALAAAQRSRICFGNCHRTDFDEMLRDLIVNLQPS